MADTYITGNTIRFAAAFTMASNPVDPTTVQAIVKAPDGTLTTYTYPDVQLVKDAVGSYHVDVPTSQDGAYRVRFVATGNGAAAGEHKIFAKSDFV